MSVGFEVRSLDTAGKWVQLGFVGAMEATLLVMLWPWTRHAVIWVILPTSAVLLLILGMGTWLRTRTVTFQHGGPTFTLENYLFFYPVRRTFSLNAYTSVRLRAGHQGVAQVRLEGAPEPFVVKVLDTWDEGRAFAAELATVTGLPFQEPANPYDFFSEPE